MRIADRTYWFFYNFCRFLVGLVFMPFYWTWMLIGTIITLTVTDGSETVLWPWEWDWWQR